MRASRVIVSALVVVALACGVGTASATSFSVESIPADGSIDGGPGATIGWGYAIANPSATDWLVLTGVSADVFEHAVANPFVFDFPVLAPGTNATVLYVEGLAGLFEMTWDVGAPAAFSNAGVFSVTGEWWSGDPLNGGTFLELAADQSVSYSATVDSVSAVPEPSTVLLMTSGAAGLIFRRKARRKP